MHVHVDGGIEDRSTEQLTKLKPGEEKKGRSDRGEDDCVVKVEHGTDERPGRGTQGAESGFERREATRVEITWKRRWRMNFNKTSKKTIEEL